MQFPRNRVRQDQERVLPLTNIVFLLLIFFMLAGRLAAPDPFNIEPPDSASERQAQAGGTVVQITADGQVAVNGNRVADGEIGPAIHERIDADAGAEVRLKADGAVAATRVVEVMTLLNKAGVDQLRLLTAAQER